MCAISGILGQSVDEKTLVAMWKTMHRRGPDGQGTYQNRDTTLLHSRLAVIDPSGGSQPMELSWAGEHYILVYNGELYNTEELRHDLLQLGHRFQGHSDTEVVLHAYAQFGTDCVTRFNGIFAFAVWEEKKARLFLARDRIGVKPLFFYHRDQTFMFASEIKTILASRLVKARIDALGASQLILLGPGRLPGSGVFMDIQELEPGCCAVFEDSKLHIRRYWKLLDREHRETFEETCECVRYLVQDAIKRQMVSDVPIGTFLSGGLDSSIITAICAGEMGQRGEALKTFSVDYENNDIFFQSNKFQPNSDREFILQMQDCCTTRHHWTVLNSQDLLQVLEDATIARDLPGMADVDFSLLAFCKEIRREVKVALSGECADEIFGGYPWYRDPEVRAKDGFPWAQNTLERTALLRPGICADPGAFILDAYQDTCRESDILPGTGETDRRTKEMVNLNFRWFMQTLLDRKDRMSMYHSLEVRVPFCDYRIAEYLYGVPWDYKDYQGREKGLLREAVKGLLPDAVLFRKKSPYPKTFDPQYEVMVSQRLNRLLKQDAPLWHLVNRETVEETLNGQGKWPWYGQLMRRPQQIAYFLQLDFWLRNYGVEMCF